MVVAGVAIAASCAVTNAALAHDICGEPPPAQFRVRNDETLKGELEGKAQLLTKFVGDASLGGKIETSQREIFAKYPDADTARTNAYFVYMFCVLLFSPENHQSYEEKLSALRGFREHLGQGPSIPQNAADEGKFEGLIMPANEPDPASQCPRQEFPPGTLKIFAGGNLFWLTKKDSHLPIVRIAGRDLLWVDRTPDGVFVSADIIREDGRSVTQVRDNKFVINTNNYFKNQSRDRHELTVVGEEGLAFKVRYANEHVLVIEGSFTLPEHQPVKVTPQGIQQHGITLSRSCYGADDTSAVLDLENPDTKKAPPGRLLSTEPRKTPAAAKPR